MCPRPSLLEGLRCLKLWQAFMTARVQRPLAISIARYDWPVGSTPSSHLVETGSYRPACPGVRRRRQPLPRGKPRGDAGRRTDEWRPMANQWSGSPGRQPTPRMPQRHTAGHHPPPSSSSSSSTHHSSCCRFTSGLRQENRKEEKGRRFRRKKSIDRNRKKLQADNMSKTKRNNGKP